MEQYIPYLIPSGTDWATAIVATLLVIIAIVAMVLGIVEAARWLGLVPRDHGRPRLYGHWWEDER